MELERRTAQWLRAMAALAEDPAPIRLLRTSQNSGFWGSGARSCFRGCQVHTWHYYTYAGSAVKRVTALSEAPGLFPGLTRLPTTTCNSSSWDLLSSPTSEGFVPKWWTPCPQVHKHTHKISKYFLKPICRKKLLCEVEDPLTRLLIMITKNCSIFYIWPQ